MQLACAPCGKLLPTIRAGKRLAEMLLLEGLSAIDVVHLDVRAPALARKHAFAAWVHATEVHLAHLVVLLVDFGGVHAWREVHGFLHLAGDFHDLIE